MAKPIRLNAFDMNCVAHMSPGLWTHPRDRAATYNTLGYWTDLARLLERGKIDALFLADVLGIYDVFRGTPDAALSGAVQVPVNDPLMLVPAMAAVTENLGFGVTCTLSYEHPYPFARRMSTLDHLTNGRIGWNIVTGYLNSAAKGVGLARQEGHDTRYEIAEDYMQLVYKLWEGSWEDGAVLRDKASGRFADPARVHKVEHDGPYFRLSAIHLAEPSVQRTPVLYQAGASTRGRAVRRATCGVRVHQRTDDARHRPDRRGPAPAHSGGGARSGRVADLQHDDGDHGHHARAGARQARGLPELRQHRRRAHADVGLDRRGFFPPWRRRRGAFQRTRRDDLGAWKRSPSPTRHGNGRCARSPITPRSAGAGQWWWATQARLPTPCRIGSRKPTWTASISPMR